MRCKVVQGRSLEIESENTSPEGATNYILVDCYNILETGIEEIAVLVNPFLTLEVQCYGEEQAGKLTEHAQEIPTKRACILREEEIYI